MYMIIINVFCIFYMFPDENEAVQGSLDMESSATNTFQSLQSVEAADPFTASLMMSESDRQHDAWIPSDATRKTLLTIATSVPGTYVPSAEELSTPGIVVDEPQVFCLQ